MKQMKTIQFPDESEPYEVVDEAARNMLAELENNNNFASKEWVLEQLGDIGNCIYGTENLVIGSSPLTTGTFYFFINGDDRIVENVYIGVDDVAEQWKPYVTGEFTVEETRSHFISYEGNSPTVECPECLTCQDDGNGTITFTGASVGSGIVRLYNGYVLIGEYTVTVTEYLAKLQELSVGSSVFLNVDGVRTEFLIIQQGIPSSAYDSSCDGTWLLLKYVSYNSPIYRSWGVSGDDYENSDIHEYLNNTFINYFDDGIKGAIKQVKIPYTKGVGTSTLANGANGLSAKLFLLSEEEVQSSTHSGHYNEGTTLSYFKSGEKEARLARDSNGGGPYRWYTRTIEKNKNYPMVASFGYDGIQSWSSPSETSKSCNRFALILPSDRKVDENFNVVA